MRLHPRSNWFFYSLLLLAPICNHFSVSWEETLEKDGKRGREAADFGASVPRRNTHPRFWESGFPSLLYGGDHKTQAL